MLCHYNSGVGFTKMPKYIHKQTIIDALIEANIEFNENATLPELRKIYDEHFEAECGGSVDAIKICDHSESNEIAEVDENKIFATDGSKISDASALPQNSEVTTDLVKSIVDAVLKSHFAAKINEVSPTASAYMNAAAGVELNAVNNTDANEVDYLNRQIALLQERREMLALSGGLNRSGGKKI